MRYSVSLMNVLKFMFFFKVSVNMKSLSIVVASYERVYQKGASSLRKSNPIPCVRMVRPHNAAVPQSRGIISDERHKFIWLCLFNNNIRAESMEFNCHFSGQIFECECMRSHVTRTDWDYSRAVVLQSCSVSGSKMAALNCFFFTTMCLIILPCRSNK